MNRSKRGLVPSRSHGSLRLAPTARAIRAALALSATMLALSGSGTALAAGSCTETSPGVDTCNGVFTDDVANHIPLGDYLPDLTLVVGADGATTVNPADGSSGITSLWGGNATVISYAQISTSDADGVHMYSDDTATFINYGDISTEVVSLAQEGAAIGAFNDVLAGNAGSIVAVSEAGGDYGTTAFYAYSLQGYVLVENAEGGVVSGQGDNGQGVGIYAHGYFGATVLNYGDVSGSSSNGAGLGIVAYALGNAGILNAGTVEAYSETGHTIGLDATAIFGGAYAGNEGLVQAESGDYAGGLLAVSIVGEAMASNSGTVEVTSFDSDGYGAVAATKYSGSAFVDNEGAIFVDAYGTAVGAAVSVNSVSFLYPGNAYVDNGGTIDAYSQAGVALGIEAYVEYGSIFVENSGAVLASSNYVATGVHVDAGLVGIENDGIISASASNEAEGGFALAQGIDSFSSAFDFYSGEDGDISATASADSAVAIGVRINAFSLYFANHGDIAASATGIEGAATGVYMFMAHEFEAYNGGHITAHGDGDYVGATAFHGYSYDSTDKLVNTGTISATSDYYSTGVYLSSFVATYIYNYGVIQALGGGTNYAIDTIARFGYSTDYIYNAGTITGAIRTGPGNDELYNEGGLWNATGSSNFGDGDDSIINRGTIAMHDAAISLGYHDVDGNTFYNYGVLSADGDGNYISMGDGPLALVPSLNPNAFYNGGTIDFQDGDTADMLTIVGDFAGDGDIDVDVSGLHEDSDILYIDGSIVTGTVGTINVDLHDLSPEIEAVIPIVYATGNSVSSNFALGEVNWDEANSFVTLDFSLVTDIHANNAEPDVFALGITVTGLSDPGTLAAAIPGAVQGLMNSQVGTWRQRMGVIDHFNDGALALWARIWTDKGGFSPEHHAANFGDGGNFDWDQKNSGVEGGIDFAVTDEFSLGLLVGKSQADIDLDSPGVGSADLDAHTWGLYGTWISPTGFYLDAVYRWMSFDVDMNSVAGPFAADGDAESFNLEAGYAWTLSGGLKIEPQLQYTKTSVDELDVLTSSSGMQFFSNGGDSSRGRFGVAIRKGFGEADTGWLWTPYATLSVVREFDGENLYSVNNTLFGEVDMEGTSTLLELGFTARHRNWAIYGGLNWQDGGAVDNFFGGQLGVRYTFGGPAPVAPPPPAPPAKTCADLDDDGDGINNCNDRCTTPSGESVGADGCALPPPAPEPPPEPKPYRG